MTFRSLGATMVEMLTGTHPWPEIKENFPIFYKLINLKEDEMPSFQLDENVSDDLKEVLKLTFTVNYDKRPSSEQLLQHAFFKSEQS